MKTPEEVKPNYAPIYAAALYPELARNCICYGYALAVHGSLARDFDLIAVPWADKPGEPQEVLDAIAKKHSMQFIGKLNVRAHGRLVQTLSIGFGECALDFSFMPKDYDEIRKQMAKAIEDEACREHFMDTLVPRSELEALRALLPRLVEQTAAMQREACATHFAGSLLPAYREAIQRAPLVEFAAVMESLEEEGEDGN